MFDQAASARKYGPMIIRCNIILLVLTTASVVVRLFAKLTTKAKYGLDDAFIVAGLLGWYCKAAVMIYAAHVGKDLSSFMDPMFSTYLKYVYIDGVLYAPTVLCISVSVLLFYRNIFTLEHFRRIVYIFITLHIMWAITTFFAQVFICYPVHLAFADAITMMTNLDKCMKYPKFFVAGMSLELGLNAAVLFLPIRESVKLKLSIQARAMLTVVFLLGGVSLISGILRIQQSYVPGEPFVDLAGDMFWLSIHVSTALIAASLPIYRPLMRTTVGFMSSNVRKIYGSYSGGYDGKHSIGPSIPNHSKGYPSAPSEHSQRSLVGQEKLSAQVDRELRTMDLQNKLGHIRVERTFNVV